MLTPIDALERGLYLGENGIVLDECGNEYRDDDGISKFTIEDLQAEELNTCDKCHIIESTYHLVWLTPDEDNQYSKEIHALEFDAVCKRCFDKIINQQ